MENNRLLVVRKQDNTWEHSTLIIRPKDPKLRFCYYIAFANFIDSAGTEVERVWISYRHSCSLVSFDARTREQHSILHCHKRIRNGKLMVEVCSCIMTLIISMQRISCSVM